MSRYQELEKRWIRYKIKKILIIFLPLLLILSLLIYLALDFLENKEVKVKKVVENPQVIKEITPPKIETPSVVEIEKSTAVPVEKIEIPKPKPKKDEIECFRVVADALNIRKEPSITSSRVAKMYKSDEFCSDKVEENWIKLENGWIYSKGMVEKIDKEYGEDTQKDSEEMAEIYIKDLLEPLGGKEIESSVETPKLTSNSTLHIETKVVDEDEIIKKLITSFKNKPDAAIALDIANRYFSNEDYKNALTWALRSNDMDNGIGSWIVFAKSKFALGQKDEAIKILETIFEKSRNKDIDLLLKEMKNSR